MALAVHPREQGAVHLSRAEVALRDVVGQFLSESTEVLEAAATLTYATRMAHSRALEKLRSLEALERETLDKAERVAAGANGAATAESGAIAT